MEVSLNGMEVRQKFSRAKGSCSSTYLRVMPAQEMVEKTVIKPPMPRYLESC